MSRLFTLCFLMLSALLPSGADAALCFEDNTQVDIHFLECETDHQTSGHGEHNQEICETHEECNDLKLLCSIETSLNSFDLVRIVTQRTPDSYSFSPSFSATFSLGVVLEPQDFYLSNEKPRVNPRLHHISSIQILV